MTHDMIGTALLVTSGAICVACLVYFVGYARGYSEGVTWAGDRLEWLKPATEKNDHQA